MERKEVWVRSWGNMGMNEEEKKKERKKVGTAQKYHLRSEMMSDPFMNYLSARVNYFPNPCSGADPARPGVPRRPGRSPKLGPEWAGPEAGGGREREAW